MKIFDANFPGPVIDICLREKYISEDFWALPVWLVQGICFFLYFCNFELDPDSIRIRSGHFLALFLFHCSRFWVIPVLLALQGLWFFLYFCNFELDPDSIRIRSGQSFGTFFFRCSRFLGYSSLAGFAGYLILPVLLQC